MRRGPRLLLSLGQPRFLGPVGTEEINSQTTRFVSQLRTFPLDGLGKRLQQGLLSILPVGFVAWYPSRAGHPKRSITHLWQLSSSLFSPYSHLEKDSNIMNKPALNDTLGGDTAVELTDVSKTFYQRHRSEKVRDVFKNLFRPTIREIHALHALHL